MAALGANVSANVYYLHELSHIYAEQGIGYERASQMARLKSCFDAGICTAVHSDFTMAPGSTAEQRLGRRQPDQLRG